MGSGRPRSDLRGAHLGFPGVAGDAEDSGAAL
jgi:hypothetical protein